MIPYRIGPYAVAVSCALVVLHCGSDNSTSEQMMDVGSLQEHVITSLATQVTVYNYGAFKTRAGELKTAAATLCKDLTQDALDATRAAWIGARGQWKRAEVVRFGATLAYPDRLGPKIDDWPLNEKPLETLLDGDEPLDEDALKKMGSGTRGMPVIEYLLWKQEDNTLTDLSSNPRKCQLLASAGADLEMNAERLIKAWRDDWIPQLTPPAMVEDSDYASVQDVLNEWVNRLGFTVENISKEKLGKPVGDKAKGKPQPDTIESPYSGRSIRDAQDALEGVYLIWNGLARESAIGVKALVRSQVLIQRINGLFDAARAKLDAIPEPLSVAIEDSPQAVKDAQEPLLLLKKAFQGDLSTELGVVITFNDADGD